MPEQSYAKHAKFVPMFHFGLFGVIVIALVLSIVNLYRWFHFGSNRTTIVVLALNCIALLMLFFFTRTFATTNQDRAIRAEENLRHYILTGKPLDSRLTIKQIVGLRFASDAEFPELTRRAADSGMSLDEIKKSVKSWRPDFDRV